jgi:hypothetical protein
MVSAMAGPPDLLGVVKTDVEAEDFEATRHVCKQVHHILVMLLMIRGLPSYGSAANFVHATIGT